MSLATVEQIRGALAESRARADQVLADAARDARSIEAGVDERVRAEARDRVRRIELLRRSITDQADAIETAYVGLVETMAAAARQLAAISRGADFGPPRWPGGIDRTIELKLSETREMTVRLSSRPGPDRGPSEEDSRPPAAPPGDR